MKPIGLSVKNSKRNLFKEDSNGELMLAHSCQKCGKISYNRIAGDDDPDAILSLLDNQEEHEGVRLLTTANKEEVLTALFGRNYPDM